MAIKHVIQGNVPRGDTIVEHWVEMQDGLPVWMASWDGGKERAAVGFWDALGRLSAGVFSGSIPGAKKSTRCPGHIEVDP